MGRLFPKASDLPWHDNADVRLFNLKWLNIWPKTGPSFNILRHGIPIVLYPTSVFMSLIKFRKIIFHFNDSLIFQPARNCRYRVKVRFTNLKLSSQIPREGTFPAIANLLETFY